MKHIPLSKYNNCFFIHSFLSITNTYIIFSPACRASCEVICIYKNRTDRWAINFIKISTILISSVVNKRFVCEASASLSYIPCVCCETMLSSIWACDVEKVQYHMMYQNCCDCYLIGMHKRWDKKLVK